jgi:hypothetical protein
MDLNQEINKAMENYIKSDKFIEDINKKAEDMIAKIMDDTFGYFGGVKKQIEELVKEQMVLNTKKLDFSGHSKFITEVVEKKLKLYIRDDAAKKISEQIDSMMQPLEKTISMERLEKELLKSADLSDYMCGCDVDMDYIREHHSLDELVTIIVEPHENYKWVNIYLDKEPNKSYGECEFNITVHETFSNFRIKEREIKARDRVMNYQFDFEDFFYQMFLNESTINYQEAKEWN